MKSKYKQTKYFKEITLSLVVATFLFSGCGSSGIDDVYGEDTETTQTDYTVRVVDDAVLNSTLISPDCKGFEERGGGYYTLTACSSRPKSIMADGGYMVVDDQNVSLGFPLVVNTSMAKESTQYTVTPLTTLLASVNTPSELNDMRIKLGFNSIDELFQYDEENENQVKLQQMLNGFFIEAKNNGVELNQFSEFTKDFRAMIKNTTGTSPLDVITNARTDFQTDFKNNQSDYLNKYGVVFGGFIMSNNFNEDPKAFLKSVERQYSDENKIVFSGFIFDDVIGSSNPKYNQDANITITNINTRLPLNLDGTNPWVMANPYGNYIAKINLSDINESNSYFLQGSVENNESKQIVLKSLLTGKEILSKFKTKLNSADIPDLTISNVTAAKAVVLEKQGLNGKTVDAIIEAKKALENNNSTLLTEVAAGFKTIIDGTADTTDNKNTYEYISSLMTGYTIFNPTSGAMANELDAKRSEILASKTLLTQLSSTDYIKFALEITDLKGKKVVFKKTDSTYDTTLLLFSDMSFTLREKDNENNPITLIGNWSIDESGDLILQESSGTTVTVSLSSLTMGGAKIENGKVIGAIPNPKGRYTIGAENIFFDVKELSDIDLTKESAPVVKFTESFVRGKTVYSVYPEYSNGVINYKDSLYRFASTGMTVEHAEDIKDESDKETLNYTVNVNDDGILRINSETYKIIKSYPTKLVVVKNNLVDYPIELFYSSVDAAASKEIKTYDKSEFKATPPSWDTDKSGSTLSTISSDQISLRAIAQNGTDYTKSSISKLTSPTTSSLAIGTKGDITVTENLGDSQRQRGVISTRYWLPNCAGELNKGLLIINVQVRNNKVTYSLQLRDVAANNKEYDILDTPVTMLEENTLNKKYSVMTLLLDNQIAIQLSDGINDYYQYIDLPTLWNAKPTYLKSFKYPTAFRNGVISAVLYDDGTENLYKGKMNTPITVKTGDFYVINGEDENNYLGGQSSVCSTASTGGSTPPVSNSTTVQNIINSFEETTATDFELWTGEVTATQYNPLTGIDVSFLGDSAGFGDVWYESYTHGKHLGKGTIVINSAPTTSTPGTITFTDIETDKFWNGSSWITNPTTSYPESRKLTKVSNGIYQIYDDLNNSAEEEIKFVQEFSATELNQMFASFNTNINHSLFTGTDKGALVVVKTLKDYYDWHEPVQNWSYPNTTPTTYNSLEAFISAYQDGHMYFNSKDDGTNTGIAFSSTTNGRLVEITNGEIVNTNAGTWSITNGILTLNITATGYHYTNAFTLKDGIVWRGEENIMGDMHSGLLFNKSALDKLHDYFKTSFDINPPMTEAPSVDSTVFTANMVSGRTIYEVYFDTTGDDTNANKSIAKFTFDGNGSTTSGTFTAIALYGNDVNSTGTGIWAITSDGRLETTFNGDVTGYNTIQATLTNGIQTSWVAGSETDINYYFYTLTDANSFGYATTASDTATMYNLVESDIANHEIIVDNSLLERNKTYYSNNTFISGSGLDGGTWSIVNGKLVHTWNVGEIEIHSFNAKPAVDTILTNETFGGSVTILGYNSITTP